MGKGISKSARKQIFNILFLLVLIGITLFILLTSNRELNFENIKKWEWNSQHMSEDIIRLLGHTTITIRKENEELRQRIIHLEQASQTQSKTISDLKEKLKHPAKTILSKVLK